MDDAVESYLLCRKHAIEVHLVLGTHKLLELRGVVNPLASSHWDKVAYPVSSTTLNCEWYEHRTH